jgi:hypothetical protein
MKIHLDVGDELNANRWTVQDSSQTGMEFGLVLVADMEY